MTAETSPDALKPCPFCGGGAQESAIGNGVTCLSCGSEVHESDSQRGRLLWNTRTPAAPDAGELAEAIERVEASIAVEMGYANAETDTSKWLVDEVPIADLRLIIAAARALR